MDWVPGFGVPVFPPVCLWIWIYIIHLDQFFFTSKHRMSAIPWCERVALGAECDASNLGPSDDEVKLNGSLLSDRICHAIRFTRVSISPPILAKPYIG